MKKLGCEKVSQGHTASGEWAVSGSSERSFRYSTLLSGLRVLHFISHLILTRAPWSWYYRVSLAPEETGAEKWGDPAEATQLVGVRVGLWTRASGPECMFLSSAQSCLAAVWRLTQRLQMLAFNGVIRSGTRRAERIVRDCKTCPSLH